MNKNIKIIMITIFICIIILAVLLGILLKMQDKEKKQEQEEIKVSSTDKYVSYYDKLTEIEEKYEFFDMQICINNYINTLKSLNSKLYANYAEDEESKNELKEYIEEQQEVLYNLLGDEYIKQFNITVQNINNNFSKYYEINIFNIENMRGIDIDNNLSIYVIDGQIMYNNNKTENYQFIVKKDSANLTFAIYPYEYINKTGSLEKAIEEIKASKQETIENKNHNLYYSQAYDDEYICKYYFNIIKNNIILNPEYIYNKLDKNYKEIRFKTLQDFENYIKEKQIKELYIQLKQYLVQENDDGTISYVCKDQYGDLYIFKQKTINNYTLTLDTYTLEQPKFNEEYEKATNQKKVMMNIDKFFQMINAKDYKAAYSVLNDEFKNNYFKTEKDFENYMKQKVFLYNDVEYVKYQDEISSIYKYDVTIKNRLDNSQEFDFSIIMQLKEGTDFVMSFSIE